jgi:iron complex transport system substrate-binding protein
LLILSLSSATFAAPQRIVSTTPSITEMLYALGAGHRVVGVTDYCHFPAEAAKKPHIGSYLQPNLEMIASLKPDLVVVEKNPLRITERLAALKLHVVEIDNTSVGKILGSIRALGDAIGSPRQAAALHNRLTGDLDDVRQKTAKLPRRSLMFVVSRSSHTLEGIMVAGRASYINELIAAAGGVNAFADAPGSYPKIGLEQILSRSPDVIVDMGEMAETAGVTEAQKQAVIELWKKVPSVAAVRTGKVYAVANDIFVVPGPRMIDAIREFARMLHPGAAGL